MDPDLNSIFSDSNYQLLDFGDGEKLERFGEALVRRETPSVYGTRSLNADWARAELRCKLDGQSRSWEGSADKDWQVQFGKLKFQLKPTPTGQVGVFPEQATNWSWIEQAGLDFAGLKALNLFGYTGGTTMALANRGAEVVHCDSAKSVVSWARANADLSGQAESTIRWLVEDAMTFVQREIKRGNRYDIVVADPPSFGRGPKGELWKIQNDFGMLLDQLNQLTKPQVRMILISCHTPEYNEAELRNMVTKRFGLKRRDGESFTLSIPAINGKQLESGCCFRWYDI